MALCPPSIPTPSESPNPDHFQKEIAFLVSRVRPPSFVRRGATAAPSASSEPQENLLWVRHFERIGKLRQALLLAFRQAYNTTWLIERHGLVSLARFRQDQLSVAREDVLVM
jgi:putative transposase